LRIYFRDPAVLREIGCFREDITDAVVTEVEPRARRICNVDDFVSDLPVGVHELPAVFGEADTGTVQ